MAESCVLYYITDRRQFSADESAAPKHLLAKVCEAASAGVDYIQLREKDLSARDLERLALEARRAIVTGRAANPESRTRLLINSRTDIALASRAHGVHLRADDLSPEQVRTIWSKADDNAQSDSRPEPVIAVSCHTPEEVNQAAENAANLAVFAPVFDKQGAMPAGLEQLRQACRARIPVLALGGVTLENAQSCLEAGAAGIAAIRLFQENRISEVATKLRQNA
jgi:thiamine-phosphate pyrophosphorylase